MTTTNWLSRYLSRRQEAKSFVLHETNDSAKIVKVNTDGSTEVLTINKSTATEETQQVANG